MDAGLAFASLRCPGMTRVNHSPTEKTAGEKLRLIRSVWICILSVAQLVYATALHRSMGASA